MNTKCFTNEKERLPSIVEPSPFDIKCGQDKALEQHYGNQCLRAKIIDAVPKYQDILRSTSSSGKKKLKSVLIKQIVSDMRVQYNSRFVRFDNISQSWIEINEKLAHEKVSHSLRTYMKRHCKEEVRSTYTTTITSTTMVNQSTSSWENEIPAVAYISPCATPDRVVTATAMELDFDVVIDGYDTNNSTWYNNNIIDDVNSSNDTIPVFDNDEFDLVNDRLFEKQQMLLEKYISLLV